MALSYAVGAPAVTDVATFRAMSLRPGGSALSRAARSAGTAGSAARSSSAVKEGTTDVTS